MKLYAGSILLVTFAVLFSSATAAEKRADSVVAEVRENLPPITSADWSSFNHDVLGWRFNPVEQSLTADNAAQITEKWRFPAEGSDMEIGVIHATPTVVNGHVYFGTANDTAFYKLRPDGTVAWIFHLPISNGLVARRARNRNQLFGGNGILTSALVTNSGVYFGNNIGEFYALDRVTGEPKWKIDTRAAGFPNYHEINIFNASAILADGKVIVGGGGYEHPYPADPSYECCTGRGFVVAFEPDTGEVVWKYEVGEEPQKFIEPVVMEDDNGIHTFQYGPSTSSVWSTPSYDKESGTIFFGTDVHNAPRKPTKDNPRYDTDYSAAVVAVDVATGKEKWVTQVNPGDIYNMTLAAYDPETGRYKDGSVGDTPKIYSIEHEGQQIKVVGAGSKNGGFFVLRVDTGEIVANTPVYSGKPEYPLAPPRDPRTIALPSIIGGIQTGCATDGRNVYTNGIDWLAMNTRSGHPPEAGRVVSVAGGLKTENWRHERPTVNSFFGESGDPIASGIAVGGGLACFTSTLSEKLILLNAETGATVKEIDVGTVWSGPSISRGRIFVGTGSMLFLGQKLTGTLHSFGLPEEDEIDRMGSGKE